MRPDATRPVISADGVGIHLMHGGKDIVVDWGEIATICALCATYPDGTPYINVLVDHISGVDFQFSSDEMGYEQTMAEMEKHLVGFHRATLEAVEPFEEESGTIPVVWERNEAVQPFVLRPPEVDPRDPTPQERERMQAAHRASIATCERILGRGLEPGEIGCIKTEFKNGRIVGHIAPPLSQLLTKQRGDD